MRQNNIALLEEFIYVLEEVDKQRPSTVSGYKKDVEQFIEYLDDTDLTKIDVRIADQWIKSLVNKDGEPIKQNTQNRKIASLKKFYAYLLDEEYITKNILKRLKPQKPTDITKKDFLEDAEIKQLDKLLIKHAANPEYLHGQNTNNIQMNALRDKALYMLMFHSGMRGCEICNLEMNEIIHYEDGGVEIYVPAEKDKSKRGKYIPIDPKLIQYIMDYRNNLTFVPENNYVFLSQNGKQLTRNTVGIKLAYFIEKAGIDKHITNHCTRHSYATAMASTGSMSAEELAMALGHSSTKMLLEVYFHNNENTRKKFSKVN